MNIITPLQGTTAVVNQLDENIKTAVGSILKLVDERCFSTEHPNDPVEFKQLIFSVIKQNIEGNVNWKVG